MRAPPLRKLLLKSMLPRLASVILIISILLLGITLYFVRLQVSDVQKQSLEGLQQDLSFIVSDTTRQLSDLAANDILINSLVDIEQRDSYLPMFFRSLNLTQANNVSFALYDFLGFSPHDLAVEIPWVTMFIASR